MTHRIYERLPSGKPKNYIDTETGAIISYRQYRNVQSQKRGFETLSQEQRIKGSKRVEVSDKLKFVQIHYRLGKPASLRDAMHSILSDYDFRHSFALVAEYQVEEEGDDEPHIAFVQSSVYKNTPRHYREAITDLILVLNLYGYKRLLAYHLVVYPPHS